MINDLFLFPKHNFLFLMEKNKFLKNNFDFELQFSTSHLADETMSEYPLEVIWPSSTATFVVDEELCYGCGACIALCPTNALDLKDRLAIVEQENAHYVNTAYHPVLFLH